ncbi:Ig-like domain-containing protein, partial [Grimontia sedimenti]|uniref:Ig-like domain-containing protein n=1 Tax=Grimontia sedimenti TaxID=2711294 RepID=UPI0034D2FAD4
MSEDSNVQGDFVTNDNTLTISGTVDKADGDKLTVAFNGKTYNEDSPELTVNNDGTWTLDVTKTELPDGDYTVTATVTDLAGNSDSA